MLKIRPMVKKILPLLIALFFLSDSFAQPLNAKSYYKAGLDLKEKNIFEAIASFKKAVSLDKKFDSAYVELGMAYSRINKNDSALWCYKKALAIQPLMPMANIALGHYYRDVASNMDSAILCYNTSLKTDSLNKMVFYSLAWCYNAKKEHEKAIPYAVKALEIDNTYKPAYNELGHAYRRTGKFKEAIEQFKKNLSVSVVDLALLYTGLCYIELKDKEGAMQQYEQLKTINERMAQSLKKNIDAMQ